MASGPGFMCPLSTPVFAFVIVVIVSVLSILFHCLLHTLTLTLYMLSFPNPNLSSHFSLFSLISLLCLYCLGLRPILPIVPFINILVLSILKSRPLLVALYHYLLLLFPLSPPSPYPLSPWLSSLSLTHVSPLPVPPPLSTLERLELGKGGGGGVLRM